MPPDFDEVYLTDEEIEILVFNERCRKYYEKKEIEKAEKDKRKFELIREHWNSDKLAEFILSRNKKFILDDQAKYVFDALTWYFTKDKRFLRLNENFSFEKGIMLAGNPGVGKSEILKLFELNKIQCFHTVHIDEIYSQCDSNGIEHYKTFCGSVPGWNFQQKHFYQPFVGWCIDDIGKEEMFFDHGNKAYLFSKIIQARYEAKHRLPFNLMHVTTMLTPEELETKYGYFLKSRFREMFNYIHYSGNDRRI